MAIWLDTEGGSLSVLAYSDTEVGCILFVRILDEFILLYCHSGVLPLKMGISFTPIHVNGNLAEGFISRTYLLKIDWLQMISNNTTCSDYTDNIYI